MERYWETHVELVSTLKEGATSSSLAPLVVKMEQVESVFVVDVEEAFPSEPREKILASASASTLSPIFPLSRYAKATQAALASLGVPPNFDPLQEFQLHLEEEYGCFCRYQM